MGALVTGVQTFALPVYKMPGTRSESAKATWPGASGLRGGSAVRSGAAARSAVVMNPFSRGPRQTMACSAPPGTIAQRILAKAPTLSPKNITPQREIAISKAFWGKSYYCASAQWHSAGEPSVVARRSDEHTSELQPLLRKSYAVFCLKQKNHTNST